MLSARTWLFCAVCGLIVACHSLSQNETKIIGTWQYATMNAVGRMTFDRNHKVIVSFPHDDTVDAHFADAKFDPAASGMWRLEGNDLVYDLNAMVPVLPGENPIPKAVHRDRIVEFDQNQ